MNLIEKIKGIRDVLTKEEIDEILKNQEIVERLKEEFEFYDISYIKHKDIDDFKIAQVLQKILKENGN